MQLLWHSAYVSLISACGVEASSHQLVSDTMRGLSFVILFFFKLCSMLGDLKQPLSLYFSRHLVIESLFVLFGKMCYHTQKICKTVLLQFKSIQVHLFVCVCFVVVLPGT